MSQRNPALNPKQGQAGLRATLRVDSSSLRATIHSFTRPETSKNSATPAQVATKTAALRQFRASEPEITSRIVRQMIGFRIGPILLRNGENVQGEPAR